MFLRGNLCWLVLCGLLAGGCSTIHNSHDQKADMLKAYMSGNNDDVLEELDENLESTADTGDEIMWRLEAGSFNFHIGRFQDSINHFAEAERLITEHDERARISARDVSSEVGSALVNTNVIPYRGWCRDRMALSIYKSLAYLGTDRESSFRAQLRRLRDQQKQVQTEYQEFFEQEKVEFEATRAQNAAAAKADTSLSSVTGNSSNSRLKDALNATSEVAHKGYGNFLNPVAIFLSGLGSIRDGNYDNARIDFSRIYQAMPDNELAQKYYVTTLLRSGRTVPEELSGVKPFDFDLERNCVFVIVASGRSAAFRQEAVYFPISTAWPVCEFYQSDFNACTVIADNQPCNVSLLADMDAILAQEFEKRLPGIITRIAINTAIKEGVRYGGTAVVAQHDEMLAAGVFVAATVYNAVTNTADTRSWEMLPKTFHLTQFPMPQNRELKIMLSGNKNLSEVVTIPDDCRSAVIFVSAPSAENTKIHVLPVKTQ